MDMDTQGAPSDSLGGGPGDAGVAMVDEDDSGDSGGSVVAMDEEEDTMEDETPPTPTPLVRQESSALLPDDIFAAAHTGDRQAVLAFLADRKGDINARDRHATTRRNRGPNPSPNLALTLVLAVNWPKAELSMAQSRTIFCPNPHQEHAGDAAHGGRGDAADGADRATAVGGRECARDRRLRLHGPLLRQLPARPPAEPRQARPRRPTDGVATGVPPSGLFG